MKHPIQLTTLCLLILLGPWHPASAQQLVVNPETGEFKLIFEDLTEPVEEFFPEKDHVGGSGRAVPFEASNPQWELPVLSLKTSRELHTAAEKVRNGSDARAGGLESFGIKAVPVIANLLADQAQVRRNVSTRAVAIPGDNGAAFAWRLATDQDTRVQTVGLSQLERWSQAARLGLSHRLSRKKQMELLDPLLKDRKDRQWFDKIRDKWDRKSTFKLLENRKAPALVHQLILEYFIDADTLPVFKDDEQDPRQRDKGVSKELAKAIRATKLQPNWKTLAQIRLGTPVGTLELERASRDPDWYVRKRVCEALRHRDDLRWDVVPVLLERQRDICLDVRLAANATLVTLHRLPHALPDKRSHKFDSLQVTSWELWWRDRQSMAKAISKLEVDEKGVALKPKSNIRTVWGDSPRTFNGLVGQHKLLGPISFLDVNRDGDVDDWGVDRVVMGNPEKILSVPLSRLLVRKGRFILIDIDSRKGRLRAATHRVRAWPVSISALFKKPYEAVGTIISSHADMNFAVWPDVTRLPAGFYNISGGWVLNKRSEAARITPPPGRGRIEVFPDKETQEVVYGPRLEVAVRAQLDLKDRKLQLRDVRVTGVAGEVYKKFDPILQDIKVTLKAGNKTKDVGAWSATYIQYNSSALGGLVPALSTEETQSFLGILTLLEASQSRIDTELTPLRAQKDNERLLLVAHLQGVPAQLTAKRAERDGKQAELTAKEAEKVSKEAQQATTQSQIIETQASLVTQQAQATAVQAQLTAKQAELTAAQAAVPPDPVLIAQLQGEVATLIAQLAVENAEVTTLNTTLATLQATLNTLASELTAIDAAIALLNTQIAVLNNEISALENNNLQYNIAAVEAEIAALDAQIAGEQAKIQAWDASLGVGAGQAGRTLELFKLALKREPGLQALAQSLGDKSWDPLEIDLKDFGDFGELDALEVILEAPDLPFGDLKTTPLLVPLE